jgi:hypothetical protein
MTQTGRRYRDSKRRLLVDMHIPDWDDAFLGAYSPDTLVDAAVASGADGVMVYFQSHVGLCYWPTTTGTRHRRMHDRDWAGEAVAGLNAAGLATCAYYSVNFNNQAWLDHPDWRLQPAAPATVGILPRERYGIVCLNNPDYRNFVDSQIDEIIAYPVSAMFFDMVWWNGVCLCPSCRARFRVENGAEIPETIDWGSPGWTDFQAARERWLAEFAVALRARVRAARPDVDVYHNFALGLANWTRGVSFASVAGHDFLGGDFYGGRAEQLVVTRLMRNLTPAQPAEFMTTAAASLIEHTGLRSTNEFRTKAFASATAGAAFLAIVAIDSDGRIEPEAIARTRAAFDAIAPFVSHAGGEPIEDVAVYCSDASRMSFDEDGLPLAQAPASSIPDYPHFHALAGACRILQANHLPFGVATRGDLDRLSRWRVLVLPNVLRMDDQEVAAIREFVRAGGRIYASRGSSIAGIDTGRRADFALADVFGCQFEAEESGRLIYAEAAPGWPAPTRPLAHWRGEGGRTGALRLRAGIGRALMTLTLPYADPERGAATDRNWASIHSSPPWTRTERPLVVRNTFGQGVAIYSGFDIEAGATPDHDALFIALIRALLPEPRFEVATHPAVWATALEQAEIGRTTLCLLHYPAEQPALPIASAKASLRLAAGRRCSGISRLPAGMPIDWSIGDGGRVTFDAGPIDPFTMIAVDHVPDA